MCYMAVTAISMMTLARRAGRAACRDRRARRIHLDRVARAEDAADGAQAAADVGDSRLWSSRCRATRQRREAGARLVAANTTTDRLVSLVDDLLDVSRLTAGRLALRLEPSCFSTIWCATSWAACASRRTRPARRSRSRSRSRSLGTWDRTRIEQVVTNLLSNAIKYGAGKPIAAVGVRRRRVGAVAGRRDHAGMGISRADQSRIFQAFERVATSSRVGGLGLGLYIGRQIARRTVARCRSRARPARGATFTLDLPLETVVRLRSSRGMRTLPTAAGRAS